MRIVSSISSLLLVANLVSGTNPLRAQEVSFEENREVENLEKFLTIPLKKLGESRQSVYGVLGVPRKVEVLEVSNRHEAGVTDKIYFLKYDGIAIEIYDATMNRPFLVYFRLERDLPLLELPLKMGTSQKTVKSLFGEPHKEDRKGVDSTYGYANDSRFLRVIFHFRNSQLRRIDWKFEVD